LFNLGFPELAVLGIFVVLFFGRTKLPELSHAISRSVSRWSQSEWLLFYAAALAALAMLLLSVPRH